MENKEEELLQEFLDFKKSKTKNQNDKHNSKQIELTVRQTIWLNSFLFFIFSLFAYYITNKFEYFAEFTLFSYLMLSVSVSILIWLAIDEFIFKEFNTFKGFEDNPIAKAIFALGSFVFMGLVVLATSGTIVFRPNVIETEPKPSTEIRHEQKSNQTATKSKVGYDSTQLDTSTKED